jgi:DnaJ-class molecular chaperone
MTYQERKEARREHFRRFVFGWRLRPCSACNGSGRYDHDGSPPCGACRGSGRERYRAMVMPITADTQPEGA